MSVSVCLSVCPLANLNKNIDLPVCIAVWFDKYKLLIVWRTEAKSVIYDCLIDVNANLRRSASFPRHQSIFLRSNYKLLDWRISGL